MEGTFCEVIGCDERADWMLRRSSNTCSEVYLCHRHWEELRSQNPVKAGGYAPLSRPGSGEGGTAASTSQRGKNPSRDRL